MISKAMKAWSNLYLYAGVGKAIPEFTNSPIPDTDLTSLYVSKFLNPVTYMVTGQKGTELTGEQLNRAITLLINTSIKCYPYLLNHFIDNGYFQYTGDLSNDIKACAKAFTDNNPSSICTSGIDGKDFIGYSACDFPVPVLMYDESLGAHAGGSMLKDLVNKEVMLLSENGRRCIKQAVSLNVIPESSLTFNKISVLVNGATTDTYMSAIDDDLPPAEVLRLISTLPQALIDENGGDIYSALRTYAETATVSDEVSKYLEGSAALPISFGASQVETPVSNLLTDEAVKQYLKDTYGYNIIDLGTMFDAPVSKLSAMVDTATIANLTGEELIEKLSDDSSVKCATLDELILTYCEQSDVSLDCTINQLIRHINYEVTIVPPTLKDAIIEYKANNGISGETTFNEFIKGEAHVHVDSMDILKDSIDSCTEISKEDKDFLYDIIAWNKPFNRPDNIKLVNETLKAIGLDNDTLSRINLAVSNGSMYEVPKQVAPVTTAAPVAFDEPGYKAGEYMLRKVREAISTNPSMDVRDKLTPVLYSFLRLLMCDPSSEMNDVREFLEQKKKTSISGTANIITEALKEFK